MHAETKPRRAMPPLVETALAASAAIGASVAWAFAMRRECDRWSRSGRRLDADAIRRISERLSSRAGRSAAGSALPREWERET